MHLFMSLAPNMLGYIDWCYNKINQADVHSMLNTLEVGCFTGLHSVPPSVTNYSIHCTTEMVRTLLGISRDSGGSQTQTAVPATLAGHQHASEYTLMTFQSKPPTEETRPSA